MTAQMKINLKHLRFFAYHGVYEEEKLLGGEFEVNVSVTYTATNTPVTSINETLDYTALYDLVKQRMATPSPLLETVAGDIGREIFAKFPASEEVTISIDKLHPPIKNFEGSVGVSYILNR